MISGSPLQVHLLFNAGLVNDQTTIIMTEEFTDWKWPYVQIQFARSEDKNNEYAPEKYSK